MDMNMKNTIHTDRKLSKNNVRYKMRKIKQSIQMKAHYISGQNTKKIGSTK